MLKIAIASGKGGTGKTFVATNLFYSLVKNNLKATLVDCDAEAPNISAFFKTEVLKRNEVLQMVPVIDKNACTYCGKCNEYCNYNAIFILPPSKIIQVIDDLCHGCGACIVACKFNAIYEKQVSLGQVTTFHSETNSIITEGRINIGVMSPVPVIKAALKESDKNADILILDSPPGTSCPFIHTVSAADYVVLVTEPTPFGLSDLKQSVETLKVINKPFGVIINRAGNGNNELYDYLKVEGITLLAEIPFNKEFAVAYSIGDLVAKKYSEFERLILDVYKKICQKKWN